MKILSLDIFGFIILLLLVGLLGSHLVGHILQTENPTGLWLYTPPADGSGRPQPAYPLGFATGLFLSTVITISVAVVSFSLSRWRPARFMQLRENLMPASIVATLIFGAGFVWMLFI